MKIMALIPARSGSKSIPNKNIKKIAGKHLIAYSIEQALKSKNISRVIVSTDSEYYARIARSYGAETPFVRPAKYSTDSATDLDVFIHVLDWLKKHENYVPDICVHLRPTHPIRKITDIDTMIKIMIENNKLDSIRSVVKSQEIPFKMWFIRKDGFLKPVIKTEIKEAYNLPRQKLPTTYYQNASIDVIRTTTITKKKSMSGKNIYGYIMTDFWDIDTITDLKNVNKYLLKTRKK